MSFTLAKFNQLRRKLTHPLTLLLTIGFTFTGAYYISAQEDTRPDRASRGDLGRGDRGGGRRGQLDLERMIERQIVRAIEALNLSEDEKTVLVPRIKAIVEHQVGRRRELRPLMEALRVCG